MSKVLRLPKTPVDGYTIVYWTVSNNYNTMRVDECKVVYHVNTPWEVYAPDDHGTAGKPLVDDWMLYRENGTRATGRLPGWQTIKNMLAPGRDRSYQAFLSRDEAVAFAREIQLERIETLKDRLAEAQANLAALVV